MTSPDVTLPPSGATATGRRSARALVLVVTLALVAGAGAGVVTSVARLLDSRSSTAASVTAATVGISLSGGASSTAWVTATNVGVGAGQAYYQKLTVTNSGTTEMRYALTGTSTSAVSPLIEVDIASIAGSTCDPTTFAAGTLITPATATFGGGTATERAIFGSKVAGADTGDQVLGASASQTLCLRAFVKPGAGRGAQGATGVTSAFTFYGEQTKNNPQVGGAGR